MSNVSLSLVITCYNEAALLEESVKTLLGVLSATPLSYEIIFVDDGSSDLTATILENLKARAPAGSMKIITHKNNAGRGQSVMDGWNAASGNILGYIDIDLEVHAQHIPSMVDAIGREGYDGAIALRRYEIKASLLLRHILSKGYVRLVRLLLSLPYRDTEAGYKFIKRDLYNNISGQFQHSGWFWDTEFMALAWINGYRIKEIPCPFNRRSDKRSSVRVISVTLQYFFNLIRFRWRLLGSHGNPSLIYKFPLLYHFVMNVIYGKGRSHRFEVLDRHIPDGASVLDVGSGDCSLYSYLQKRKTITYLGIDCNFRLLKNGSRRGAAVRLLDIRNNIELPRADVVVMQSSLYQFIPDHSQVIQRLLRAARTRVVISEPIQNWATNASPLLKRLFNSLTNPGTGLVPHRFSKESLGAFYIQYGAKEVYEVLDGRELVGVFETSTQARH